MGRRCPDAVAIMTDWSGMFGVLALCATFVAVLWWASRLGYHEISPAPEPLAEGGRHRSGGRQSVYDIRLRIDHGRPCHELTLDEARLAWTIHRTCSLIGCDYKRGAFRTLVREGKIVPDPRSERFTEPENNNGPARLVRAPDPVDSPSAWFRSSRAEQHTTP